MKNLVGIGKIVQQILIEMPKTRQCDSLLILEYYRRKGINIHSSFMTLLLSGQLADMESITRCRRKIQECFPELRDGDTVERRHAKQELFEDFARNTNKETFLDEYNYTS